MRHPWAASAEATTVATAANWWSRAGGKFRTSWFALDVRIDELLLDCRQLLSQGLGIVFESLALAELLRPVADLFDLRLDVADLQDGVVARREAVAHLPQEVVLLLQVLGGRAGIPG